ncbi:PIG-L deacetylase family protein [Desertimonas flava]|uniref:PIG-L deacetylase family protein n=1 Tax=Desertimonas flava TaxID=2064846 RepID=UPI000E34BF5A|nr:PIG-L family deacetylase [Desertimonas flava]
MLIGTWTRPLPLLPERVVVIAPHPDDEVLGCGMTMRWLSDRACDISLVACTDGEGSHRRSAAVSPEQLRVWRAEERARALELLGLAPSVLRLGLPDGELAESTAELTDALTAAIAGADVVIAPWLGDGHPDHEAVSRSAARAARRRRLPLWCVPVWGKVRRSRPYDGRVSRLRLSADAQEAKAAAAAAFVSQLRPVGAGPHDGPVVHPSELTAMLDGEEVLLW